MVARTEETIKEFLTRFNFYLFIYFFGRLKLKIYIKFVSICQLGEAVGPLVSMYFSIVDNLLCGVIVEQLLFE